MTDAIAGLDPLLKFIGLLGVAVGAIAGFWRWVLPKYRNAKSDARAIRDTLVGRDPIYDSITHEVIQPAIPGIGSRMADQEANTRGIRTDVSVLTRAVADLASAQADMTALQARMDDHDRRLTDNDQRLTAIEQGHHLERLAGKAESIHLYRAIESIANNGDDDTDPAA